MQLAQVEREIAALLERLPEADGVLLRYIKQRIEELDGKKRELTERISRHQRREEGGTEIGDPSALWGCWTLRQAAGGGASDPGHPRYRRSRSDRMAYMSPGLAILYALAKGFGWPRIA